MKDSAAFREQILRAQIPKLSVLESLTDEMLKQYRKDNIPLRNIQNVLKEESGFNEIDCSVKSAFYKTEKPIMHVPQETIVALNVLAGNFQVSDEAMIPKLKRAGREFVVIQFPAASMSKMREVVADNEVFDRMMANVVETVQGLSNPNMMVEMNVSSDRSVFAKVHHNAKEFHAHCNKLKEAEEINESLRRLSTDINNAELRKKAVDLQIKKELAEKELTESNDVSTEIRDNLATLDRYLSKLRGLMNDPTLTAQSAIRKLETQKAHNTEFENLLSGLATEEDEPTKA